LAAFPFANQHIQAANKPLAVLGQAGTGWRRVSCVGLPAFGVALGRNAFFLKGPDFFFEGVVV
jgi:hypothetical protein